MINLVESRLSETGYHRIGVNAPGIGIYFHVSDGICYVVFLVDYHNPAESSVTTEYLINLNRSVDAFLRDRGYNDIRFLSLIVTYSEYVAEDLAGEKLSYWVLDTYHTIFVRPPGQVQQFGGFEQVMNSVMNTLSVRETVGQSIQQNSMQVHRKTKRKFRILSVNNLIVAVNVLVWIYLEMNGSTESARYMLNHGAFYWPSVKDDGEIYRFFTCMFIHFGFIHLAGNMITLLYLGDNLERAVGAVKYTVIYISTGLAASVVSCLYYIVIGKNVVSGGASGAIFGVIGALVYIVTINNRKLEDLNSYSLIGFAVYQIVQGFRSTGVDVAAHVGGFVAGLLVARLLYKKPQEENYNETGGWS